jgi:hypothetical protein
VGRKTVLQMDLSMALDQEGVAAATKALAGSG